MGSCMSLCKTRNLDEDEPPKGPINDIIKLKDEANENTQKSNKEKKKKVSIPKDSIYKEDENQIKKDNMLEEFSLKNSNNDNCNNINDTNSLVNSIININKYLTNEVNHKAVNNTTIIDNKKKKSKPHKVYENQLSKTPLSKEANKPKKESKNSNNENDKNINNINNNIETINCSKKNDNNNSNIKNNSNYQREIINNILKIPPIFSFGKFPKLI